MTYWFVFELVVHVGILEFDPHVWKYYKAIFWTGKEDLHLGAGSRCRCLWRLVHRAADRSRRGRLAARWRAAMLG